MNTQRPTGALATLIALLALAAITGLAYMNLWHGNLNQDEGWYLNAAREVAAGERPYRDFAYTQAPVLPFVYAPITPLVEQHGLLAGRIFTQILGLGSILFAALLAARLAPGRRRSAFVFCLVLAGVCIFQSYYTTVVKTYALTAFFLTGGCLLAACASRKLWWLAVPAGFLLALAAGTRISAGLALPIIGLTMLAQRKRVGDAAWFSFGIGGILGLALAFLPAYLAAPEGFRFGILDYHAGRTAPDPLLLKAGFLSRLAQDYLVAFVCLAAILLGWLWPSEGKTGKAGKGAEGQPSGRAWLWGFGLLVLAVTGLHLSAAFPYDDYQVILYPLFCALLAPALARVRVGWLLPLVFLASVAASGSSPIVQEWFIEGRDRVWWKSKEKPDIVKLQEAAAEIRALAGSGEGVQLLTQDAYLAVESGLELPPGLEMGPFSYYPEMETERASALHLHNRESFANLLATSKAPVAAISGYSLSIACPQVAELELDEQARLQSLLERHYEFVRAIPSFGQGHTTLRIYRKK